MDDSKFIGQPVRSLQTMLRTVSRVDPAVPPVVPDGIYGRNTIAAVSAFQKRAALPVTGVVDFATWSALVIAFRAAEKRLYPEPLDMGFTADLRIQPGEAHLQLYVVQAMLAAMKEVFKNVPPVTVSGRHDAESARAVRWLQEIFGLPADGVFDMTTWHRLKTLYENTMHTSPRTAATP